MYLNRYQLEILAAVHEEAKACMNLYKMTSDESFKKELLLKMQTCQNKIKKIKGEKINATN